MRTKFLDWLSVYFKEKPDEAVDKKEWLLRTVETATDSCTCCCNTVQIVNLISAISRYAKIRKEMFGDHPYYFLPKPSKEVMELMNMTFQQFLEKNNLLALTPIIDIGVTAQGFLLVESPIVSRLSPSRTRLLWTHVCNSRCVKRCSTKRRQYNNLFIRF